MVSTTYPRGRTAKQSERALYSVPSRLAGRVGDGRLHLGDARDARTGLKRPPEGQHDVRRAEHATARVVEYVGQDLHDDVRDRGVGTRFERADEADVDQAIDQVRQAVEKLRDLSPLWDMYKDGVDLDKIEWAAH